jgi:hypothetical protein
MSSGGQRALAGSEAHPGLKTLLAFSMADEYVAWMYMPSICSQGSGKWREMLQRRRVVAV